MKKEYNIFSNFKGFGNPNAKIWFVGLEEATDFENHYDKLLIEYSKEYFPFEKGEIEKDSLKFGNKYTSVYDIMSKIATGLNDETNWKTYRNNSLLTTDGDEFQMNLYPLGKKHLHLWSDFYQDKFGFKDKNEYLENVRDNRFQELFKHWNIHSPKFTICFGKGNTSEFKKLFKVTNEISLDNGNLLFFPIEKVVMTPFFHNGHMSMKRIKEVVKLIKNNI